MILALGLTVSNVNPRATLYLGGTDASLAASWYSDEGLTTLAGRIPNANDIVEFRGASRTITGGFTCYMLKLTQSSRTWTINCDVATFDLMLITGNSVAWAQYNNTFTGNVYCSGTSCTIFIDIHEFIPGMLGYDDLYITIAGSFSTLGGNTSGLLTMSGASSSFSGYHAGYAIFSGQESTNIGETGGPNAIFSGASSNNGNSVTGDAYFLGAFSINEGGVSGDAYVALGAGSTGTGDIGGTVSGSTFYPYTPP
jgi:hypothetical protein